MSDAATDALKSIPTPDLKPGGGFKLPAASLPTPEIGDSGLGSQLRAPLRPAPRSSSSPKSPQSITSDTNTVTGPVTPDMIIQAGFPEVEAADWAALANWITRGESKVFNEGYGGFRFNNYSKHPKDLGWAGGVGPDGSQTHAAGLFQDQPDTWHKIQLLFGISDFTPINQIKGNLLWASKIYHDQTGRSLLTDFKSGNTTAIASALHNQWTSLGKSSGSTPGTADFDAEGWIRGQSEALTRYGSEASRLMAEALRQSPGSAERHQLLKEAITRSREMADEFREVSKHPPKPQSPFDVMSDAAPLMIGLLAFAGALTRRPALGAMNAISGALTGLKQGSDQIYERSLDVWKTQSKLASDAFHMENEEIRNILEDEKLEENEKQARLRIAFEMLGLKKELELARANLPKELYDYLQTRQKFGIDLEEKRAKIEKELAEAQRARAQAALGGSTNPTLISWNQLRHQWRTENNWTEDQEIPPDVDNQLLRQAQTQSKGITPKQQQENSQITDAKKYIGELPSNFEKVLTDYMAGKIPVPDRDQKGWTDLHKRLLEALHRPTFEKTAADTELIKQYELSKKPLIRPTSSQTESEERSSMTQIELDQLVIDALSTGKFSEDEIRDQYIKEGGTSKRFNELIAQFKAHRSGAAGRQPVMPTRPFSPSDYPAAETSAGF